MNSELLSRERSALVVIDIQERLFPSIHERELILARTDLLLTAATVMKVPIILTEQYPKGLGRTLEEIRKIVPEIQPLEKMHFSCTADAGFAANLAELHRSQIVLCGIETHICVAQTALELAARGEQVFVAADATGSRRPLDYRAALERLRDSGVKVTTSEAVVFEWLRLAGTEEFKTLQPKLKNI